MPADVPRPRSSSVRHVGKVVKGLRQGLASAAEVGAEGLQTRRPRRVLRQRRVGLLQSLGKLVGLLGRMQRDLGLPPTLRARVPDARCLLVAKRREVRRAVHVHADEEFALPRIGADDLRLAYSRQMFHLVDGVQPRTWHAVDRGNLVGDAARFRLVLPSFLEARWSRVQRADAPTHRRSKRAGKVEALGDLDVAVHAEDVCPHIPLCVGGHLLGTPKRKEAANSIDVDLTEGRAHLTTQGESAKVLFPESSNARLIAHDARRRTP